MDFNKIPDHTGPFVKILNTAIENNMNARASELDLTGTQMHCLHYLCKYSGENITQHMLEKTFSLNHATLSGIISRLEAKGFVKTENCPEDRRQKFIRPTEKAFDCDSMMHARIAECEEKIAYGIDEEELALVRKTLIKMIKNITPSEDTKDEGNNA